MKNTLNLLLTENITSRYLLCWVLLYGIYFRCLNVAHSFVCGCIFFSLFQQRTGDSCWTSISCARNRSKLWDFHFSVVHEQSQVLTGCVDVRRRIVSQFCFWIISWSFCGCFCFLGFFLGSFSQLSHTSQLFKPEEQVHRISREERGCHFHLPHVWWICSKKVDLEPVKMFLSVWTLGTGAKIAWVLAVYEKML